MTTHKLAIPILLAVVAMAPAVAEAAPDGTTVLAEAAQGESPTMDHPGVAVDGETGAIHVTYGSESDGVRVYATSSTDGGATWGEPVRVSTEDDVAMPHAGPAHIEVGPDGTIYVLYQITLTDQSWIDAGFTFGFTSLHLAISEDGGETFLPSAEVYATSGPDQADPDLLRSKNFESMTVSGDGRVYITWLESRGQTDGAWPPSETVITWTDDGTTFAEPQIIKSDVCPCCATSACFGPDGSVHVMFRDIQDNPGGMTIRDMVMATSGDGGSTWEEPLRVGDDRFEIDSCPHSTSTITTDDEGRIHAAWWTMGGEGPGTYYSVSADGGSTWEEPLLLDGGEWYPATQIKIVVDSDGTPIVAWADPTVEYGAIKYAVIRGGAAEVAGLGAGDHPWLASAGGVTALVWAADGQILIKTWHDPI